MIEIFRDLYSTPISTDNEKVLVSRGTKYGSVIIYGSKDRKIVIEVLY